MIMIVDSGRVVDTLDTIALYLRKVCIGLRPMTVREDPNHNYMFSWIEKPPSPYTPPILSNVQDKVTREAINTSPMDTFGMFTTPPGIASPSNVS